jgi:hypothetical protein
VYCKVKLSGKPWHHQENIVASCLFGVLSMIGYLSVISSVYCFATGKTIIGNRGDIIYQ